jgi:adenosine deaminase
MDLIRERGITLEVCPTSNLNSRVVSGWDEFKWIFETFRRNGVRYTINTDGPEMLKTYIRDELASLARHGILSVEEQEQAASWAREASFVPGVAEAVAVTPPRRTPATRRQVEREEA